MKKSHAVLMILAVVVTLLLPALAEAECRKCTYIWFNGWYCIEDPEGWTKCVSGNTAHCQDSSITGSVRCSPPSGPLEPTPSPLIFLDGEKEVVSSPLPVDGAEILALDL